MKLSFRQKLFIPLVISWVSLLAIVTANVMRERSLHMEEHKTRTAIAGELALSIVKEYAAKAASGLLPEPEAKEQALARIRALRYGGTSYFMVVNSQVVLMHPIKPDLEGSDIAASVDTEGRKIGVEAVSAAKSGEGFTYYMWTKPGTAEPERKVSYSAYYAAWDWTIVNGVYVGDIDIAVRASLLHSALVLALVGLVLSTIVLAVVRNIEKSIGGEPEQAVLLARRIASGDLEVVIHTRPGDDTSLMAAMKSMRSSLARIVSEVRSGTATIAAASSEIAGDNSDLSMRTERQAASLQQTASSMEGMASTVKQNAKSARQADTLAQCASSIAARGGEIVNKVVETMASINESSHKVVDIIGIIDGIAFQTNILALNVAVEAARAGEHGRGVAVVAAEVRQLAERSAVAAREIKALIGTSVSQVGKGTRYVTEAGATMEELVKSVERVSAIVREITVATEAQTDDIDQMNKAIGQIDEVTQKNSALVEEVAAASEAMQQEASQLSRVVGVFRLAEPAGSARTGPGNPSRCGLVLA